MFSCFYVYICVSCLESSWNRVVGEVDRQMMVEVTLSWSVPFNLLLTLGSDFVIPSDSPALSAGWSHSLEF